MVIVELGGIDRMVRDFYGNILIDGLYFASDEFDKSNGDIYLIKLDSSRKTFSAESHEGFMPIKNYKLFAKQLIPLSNSRHNLEFALSKISEIVKT